MKRKFLKLLALSIVAVMLSTSTGVLSVSAAEETVYAEVKATGTTVIEAESFDKKLSTPSALTNLIRNYDSSNPAYPNKTAVCMHIAYNCQAIYPLDVKEAGTYKLNMYMAGAGLGILDIAVGRIDHQEHYLRGYTSRAFNYTTSTMVEEFYGGTIELPAGQTYLTIKRTAGHTEEWFYYFTLERVENPVDQKAKSGPFKAHMVPGIIQAEDYDRGETGSYGTGASGSYVYNDIPKFVTRYREDSNIAIEPKANGGYDLLLNEGEWANYTFDVKGSGMYTVSIGAEWTGKVGLYLDGREDSYEGAFIQSDEVKETKIASFYLEEGRHTLTLKSHDFRTKQPKIDYIAILPGDTMDKTEQVDTGIYKEYYVATKGNDKTGDGSKEKPFASVARAKDEVAKVNDDMTGDIIVYVEPGTYKIEETVKFGVEDSGKNGHSIIYKGVDTSNPSVMSGGQKVTGWAPVGNGSPLWSAPLSGQEHVRNLYINEIPASRAKSKYINQLKWYTPEKFAAEVTTDVKTDCRTFVIEKENSFVDFDRLQDVELRWTWSWESCAVPIKEIIDIGDKWLIIPAYPMMEEHSADASLNGFFENAMELLDEPGEFYWNRDEERIYYYPFREEDLTTAETYVGDTEMLFKLEGESLQDKVENITFDNLKIIYGAWNFASTYGFVGSQGDGLATCGENRQNQIAGQIDMDNANNIIIKNCELACLGSLGINATHNVSNLKIEGNIIRDISNSGIKFGCREWRYSNPIKGHQGQKGYDLCENVEIYNNYITRIGGEFYNSIAISIIYATDAKVFNNVIKDTPYSGMHLNWGWNSLTEWKGGGYKVSYNRIESVMQMTRDGAGTYILGETHGAEFSYNYYKDHDAHFDGTVMYSDSGTKNVEYHHNVVEDATNAFNFPYAGGNSNMSNLYAHDNYVYNCYSLAGADHRDGPWPEEHKINMESPYEIRPGEEWPQEALDIIAGAGLSAEYKHLESKVKEYPEWRPHRNSYVPEQKFSKMSLVDWGIHMEIEHFMSGGEGVGFHKILKVNDHLDFRPETEVGFYYYELLDQGTHVLASNAPGEWLNYEIEVPESGYYKLQYNANSIMSRITDGNFPPCAKIYVDGEEITKVTVPWESYVDTNDQIYKNFRTVECGEYYLEKGKHIVRMEIMAAHLANWIKFYTDDMQAEHEAFLIEHESKGIQNAADYKEAQFTSYEESIERLNAVKKSRATFYGQEIDDYWAEHPELTVYPDKKEDENTN